MPVAITRQLGETFEIVPHPRNSAGDELPLDGLDVSYVSADEAVAPVTASGIGTARALGTTVITTAIGDISDTTTVTVIPIVSRVEISPADTTLEAGATLALSFAAFDADDVEIPGLTGAWDSGDDAIGTVNASTGVVTGTGYGDVEISVVVNGVVATRTLHVISKIERVASFRLRPDRDGYTPAALPPTVTFGVESFYAESGEQGGLRMPMPNGVWSRAHPNSMDVGTISPTTGTGGWTWTPPGLSAPVDSGANSGPFVGTRAQRMTLNRRAGAIYATPEGYGDTAMTRQYLLKQIPLTANVVGVGKPWISGFLAIRGVRTNDVGRKVRLLICDNTLATVYASTSGTLGTGTGQSGWTFLGVDARLPAPASEVAVMLEFPLSPDDANDSAANAQTQVDIWGMGGRAGRLPANQNEWWAPYQARPASSADAGIGGIVQNPLPIYPGLGMYMARQSKNHLYGSDNWFVGNTFREGGGATVLSADNGNDFTYGSNAATGDARPVAVRFPQNSYIEPWGSGSTNQVPLKGDFANTGTGGNNLPGSAIHVTMVLRSYNGGALPADGAMIGRLYHPVTGSVDVALSRETWWAGDAVYTGRAIVPSSYPAQAAYPFRFFNISATQYDVWVVSVGLERDGYNGLYDENGPRAQPVPVRTSYDQTTGAASPGSMLKLVPASDVLTTKYGAALFRWLWTFDPFTYAQTTFVLQMTDVGPGGNPNYGLNVQLLSTPSGGVPNMRIVAKISQYVDGSARSVSVTLPITALGQFPACQQNDLAVMWDSAYSGNTPIASSWDFTGLYLNGAWRDDLLTPVARFSATVGGSGALAGATSVPVVPLPSAIPSGTTLNFGGGKTATLTADALAGAVVLAVSPLPLALSAGDAVNTDWDHQPSHRLCPMSDQDHRIPVGGFLWEVDYVNVAVTRLDVATQFASWGARKSLGTGGVVA